MGRIGRIGRMDGSCLFITRCFPQMNSTYRRNGKIRPICPICLARRAIGEGRVPSRGPILKFANIAAYPAKRETLPERTAMRGSHYHRRTRLGVSRTAEIMGAESVAKASKLIYASSNGDQWFLARDVESGQVVVRHIPNPASGGELHSHGDRCISQQRQRLSTAPGVDADDRFAYPEGT